jgi:pimeloyl-ACP methyl ester carboxylesterase
MNSHRIGTRSPWQPGKGLFISLLLCSLARGAERESSPHYAEHQDLSYFLNVDGSRSPIRTGADWEKRRQHIIAEMEEVMGPLPRPASPVPLDMQVVEESEEDGYIRRKLAYHTDDANKRVRAWLLLPSSSGNGAGGDGSLPTTGQRRAAVLCLHQTTPNGKDSPVGLADRPTLHYAKELALRGYVTLSPDYPSFGESNDYDFKADNYVSGTMKAIYDNVRAIDLLQALPEVDPDRVGCIGHSLGGHNTLFTAVFDPRIKVAVTCCGFTSFHRYKGGDLKGWTSARYMPLITTKYNNSPDKMPFDFAEVLAAIAPRAVFVVAPLHDDNFDITGVHDCVHTAKPIFRLLGVPNHLEAVHPDAPHEFPDAQRRQSYNFLDEYLKSRPKRQ